MRLVTFSCQGQMGLGALVQREGRDSVLDFRQVLPDLPADMIQFLSAGDAAMDRARQAVLAAESDARGLLPLADVALLAPVPRPGKIICMGYNYFDHLGQGRTEPPEYPTLFCKTANTVIGPSQPIVIPRVTSQVDYEAELAVVVGRRARHVAQAQAFEYVAGYTIFNDVSARDYQKRTNQWMQGKSFDTFGPMGPALVTRDEIPDPHVLDLWLTLNGLELQRTNTRHMIFTIPWLIAYLSDIMTLEPGDVISTGTPAKAEAAKRVPPFIKPGDQMTLHIDRIGELANLIVSEV